MAKLEQCKKCGYFTQTIISQTALDGGIMQGGNILSTMPCVECEADYCMKMEIVIEDDGVLCMYYDTCENVNREAYKELKESMREDPLLNILNFFS